MAASLTHLVTGEKVFARIHEFASSQDVYACFLAGCTLVDVHAFHDVDRTVTHFAGHLENASTYHANKSCELFLVECPGLLAKPWEELDPCEQAFAAGYLCHLAADECWKQMGKKIFRHLGISRWTELPVHPDVILTAFDHLCRKEMQQPELARIALDTVYIPQVFLHVSQEVFNSQWYIIREYLAGSGTQADYVHMLEKSGRLDDETRALCEQRFTLWQDAVALLEEVGGAQPFLDCAVSRSLEVIPELWLQCG